MYATNLNLSQSITKTHQKIKKTKEYSVISFSPFENHLSFELMTSLCTPHNEFSSSFTFTETGSALAKVDIHT